MDTKNKCKEKARKKRKGNTTRFLPDHLIISNILCRLPPKFASQSQLVCKGWRDLTLTWNFVDLHLSCSFPTIMVAYSWWCCNKCDHLNLLDKWWETARKRLMIHTFPFDLETHTIYEILFSHAGLIAFKKDRSQVVSILNPVNNETVTISISIELSASTIYGVFFHPKLKKYCSLWRMEGSLARQIPIEYKLLILGSSPFVKKVSNPFIHRVKKRRSLLIDKYLYWMLEAEDINGRSDIMQFDIIGEEFSVKPCPVPLDTECNSMQMHILNIDGVLAFVAIFPREITVWRLNNDPKAKELWTATKYSFFSSEENFKFTTEPIAVVDGKLALSSDRRLVVCDLMQGTTKCFRKMKYPFSVYFLSHQMSLASLKNCQASLYIDENGELGCDEKTP